MHNEQKIFIEAFALPEPYHTQCQNLFKNIAIKSLVSNPSIDEKKLSEHLISAGFSIIRISRVNRTQFHDGEVKIIMSHQTLEHFIIKLQLPFQGKMKTYPRENHNLSRLIGADKIRRLIQEKKLKHIVIPQKYLFKIPEGSNDLSDENYATIVEKIDIIKPQNNTEALTLLSTLSYAHFKELLTVIQEIGLCDIHLENIYLTTDNKIAIIDTEARKGMWSVEKPFQWMRGLRRRWNGVLGTARLYKNIPQSVNSKLLLSRILINLGLI